MPSSQDDMPRAATTISPPSLRGERLILRGFRDEDLHALYALHADPKVMRYWSCPAWTELAQARERLAQARTGSNPDSLLCWAIARRIGDEMLGSLTMFGIDRAQGRAGIGYALQSAHWKQGFAREALQLALAYAFDDLGLRRIEADIDPRNAASCALAERLGFVREGLLRQRWDVAGELQDSAIYGLLASEWRASRGQS